MGRVTNNNNGKKPLTLRDIVYVALISFLTPFAAKYGLNVGDDFSLGSDKPLSEISVKANDNYLLPQPFGASPSIQQSTEDQVSMIFDLATKLADLSNPAVESVSPQSIPKVEMWLDSPVTQEWIYDYEKDYWSTAKDWKDSFKSPPSIKLGLRDDGTVVWKKIESK